MFSYMFRFETKAFSEFFIESFSYTFFLLLPWRISSEKCISIIYYTSFEAPRTIVA